MIDPDVRFEVPRGEHVYIGSRLHSQLFATFHADTPRDDYCFLQRWNSCMSEYPKLNTMGRRINSRDNLHSSLRSPPQQYE